MAGNSDTTAKDNETLYRFPSSPTVGEFTAQASEAQASASTFSVDAYQTQRQNGKDTSKHGVLKNGRTGLLSLFRRFTS